MKVWVGHLLNARENVDRQILPSVAQSVYTMCDTTRTVSILQGELSCTVSLQRPCCFHDLKYPCTDNTVEDNLCAGRTTASSSYFCQQNLGLLVGVF